MHFLRMTSLCAALACAASLAQVNPPPLPAGSDRVKVAPGLQESERRHTRAPRNLPRRDFDVDDERPLPPPAAQAASAPCAAGRSRTC